MELIVIFLVFLLLFDIAALYLGHDSRDSIHSGEWERRRQWDLRFPIHHF